jgi:ketosteroid isomerase-like protein
VEEARRDAGVTSDLDRIREVNDAINAGDVRRAGSFLDPDVVWEHNLGVGSPEEGVYRGRDSVVALYERILEPWEQLRAHPREIRVLGGGAFDIRGDMHAKHATSAVEVNDQYVQHMQVRDGLLVKGGMTTGVEREWERGDAEVVHAVVEAFREHDIPRLRSLFHDDSEFHSVITGAGGNVYRGLEEIEGYMRDVEDAFEGWHSEDELCIDAGDGRVALLYRVVGRGKGSGVPVDQPISILWTVRDGKIARAQGYRDPEEALVALGLKDNAHVE